MGCDHSNARVRAPVLLIASTFAALVGCGSADDTGIFRSPSSTSPDSVGGGMSDPGGSGGAPSSVASGGALSDGGSASAAGAGGVPDATDGGGGRTASASGLPIGGPISADCDACATAHCGSRVEDCLEDGPCMGYFACFASCTLPCWECLFHSVPAKANELLKCAEDQCPGLCPVVQ